MQPKIKLFISAIAATGLQMPSHAQTDRSQDGWIVGGGVVYESSIIKDGNDLILPLPFAEYNNGRFHAGFDNLSYDIVANDILNLEVLGTFRDTSFSGDDLEKQYPTLKRNTAIEVGLAAEVQLGIAALSSRIVHDISGVHDGLSGVPIGKSILSAEIGATYKDEDVSLYEYGVSSDEATDTLVAYQPEDNWTPYFELSAAYPLSDKSMLIAAATHELIPDEIFNSPIVEKNNSTSIGIFYVRSF